MRCRPARFALFAAAAMMLGSGCLDNGTTAPPPPKFDRGGPPPDGPVDKLPPPALDLGRIPSRVCGDEVGIIGSATPGVTIIVTGGSSASGVIGDAHPLDGKFCVAVKLRVKQANTLHVIAQDPSRGLSVPAIITVIQEDCGGGGGEFKDAGVGDGGSSSKNIAFSVIGKSKENPIKGNHGFLTDGKTSTWVSWEGAGLPCNWCDYKGWVMITLDQVAEVERIVIKWRDKKSSGTDYGSEYKLLYTSVTEPPDPNLDDGFWTVAKDIQDGDGGIDDHNLKSFKPLIRHVALWLLQDGLPWTSEWSGEEVFAISEIEVWEAPKGSGPPPPPPNVCQGG